MLIKSIMLCCLVLNWIFCSTLVDLFAIFFSLYYLLKLTDYDGFLKVAIFWLVTDYSLVCNTTWLSKIPREIPRDNRWFHVTPHVFPHRTYTRTETCRTSLVPTERTAAVLTWPQVRSWTTTEMEAVSTRISVMRTITIACKGDYLICRQDFLLSLSFKHIFE